MTAKKLINYILWPFALSRVLLLITGWFSQYFAFSQNYFPIATENKNFVNLPIRFLDIWGRWDTGWYLKIAQYGVNLPTGWQDSVAFWPLYPELIKIFSLFSQNKTILYLTGLVISNLSFILSLIFLYKLILIIFQNKNIARLGVLYLLVFPTSFIFSCVYSEALFLALTLLAFLAAEKKQFLLAVSAAALSTITRSMGIFILLPLFLIFLKHNNFKKNIKNFLYLFLIPTPFLIYLIYLKNLTGNFLIAFKQQSQWQRSFTWPLKTLAKPAHFIGYVSSLDKFICLLFIFLLLISFLILPLAYSLYALILILLPLFTGTLLSLMRLYNIIFPVFISLAYLGYKYKKFKQASLLIFLTLQILLFAAWCQLYWVG